jgi:hypothetical protein
VLLITLTFRSSDYITILFGSGAELFLPESLRSQKPGFLAIARPNPNLAND